MAAHALDRSVPAAPFIPLLDASSLPAAEDWALLESIQMNMGSDWLDPESDRDGGFRLAAAFDD